MHNVQKRGVKFQLRVTHKLLPKPFFHTFDDEVQARNYGEQLDALLFAGVVPQELLLPAAQGSADLLLIEVVRLYTQQSAVLTDSDDALLDVVIQDKPLVGLRLSMLTFMWVETYLKWLKSAEMRLVPSTIRKRIGVLGRVMDWHIKRTTKEGATPLVNPLRLLPRGYSIYSKADAPVDEAKADVARDRRLGEGDGERILAALAGHKREDRQRAIPFDPAFTLLYEVIVTTGVRLFEAYKLRVDMIDFKKEIINIEGSKGHRGVIKPRTVPINPVLLKPLKSWCKDKTGLLFPFWDGTKEHRPKVSAKLSARFVSLFQYAEIPDFTEHDLRHEATCRWFELRTKNGWMFSEIDICKIMGWSDSRMALRYASLRGEDLSSRFHQ